MAPSIAPSSPTQGPGLHLDQGAQRELGDADGRRAGRWSPKARRRRPRSSRRSRSCGGGTPWSSPRRRGRRPRSASWASRLASAWRSSPPSPRDELPVGDADLAGHDEPRRPARWACTGPTGFAGRGHGETLPAAGVVGPATPVGHGGGPARAASQAAAATAANTASEPLTGGPPTVDRHLDRRRVDGPQDAEAADRQVVHLAGLVDRQALAADPPERHVGGADAVRAQRPSSSGSPQLTRHPPRRPGTARRRASGRVDARWPSWSTDASARPPEVR